MRSPTGIPILAVPVLALLLVGPVAAAQGDQAGAPAPAMTLGQALAYARAHQPQVRRALAEIAARRAEARVPRAAWYPQLGATAQVLYGSNNNTTASYLNVPEVDLPRIGGTGATTGTSWTPSPSTLAAVTLDQEIFDFGRFSAQAAVLDTLAELAQASAQAVALDIDLGVEEAFSGVTAARAILRATQDAERRAQVHFNLAAAGVRSGMRPPIDQTRSQAELARAQVQRTRAESSLVEAQAGLAAAVGSAALQIDAAAPEGQPLDQALPILEDALGQAAARNPAVAEALARLRAQRATTSAIGKEMLPNLFLSGTLSGRAGGALPASNMTPLGAGWLPDVGNWHLAAVLQWDLFDATVLARRSASQVREAVARADLDVTRLGVTLQVQRAYLDLQAAVRTLPGLVAALDAARANQAQAEARFRAGLGTIIDLTDAEALLTGAQVDLAIGQFSVLRARAQLGRAVGETAFKGP